VTIVPAARSTLLMMALTRTVTVRVMPVTFAQAAMIR